MNEKDIITAAMKSCGWTQKELAAQAGYNTQSAISNRLGGKSMRVDTFVKLLSAMGYEVVVRSTSPNTNKNRWVVGEETESPSSASLPNLDEILGIDESSKRCGRIKLSD